MLGAMAAPCASAAHHHIGVRTSEQQGGPDEGGDRPLCYPHPVCRVLRPGVMAGRSHCPWRSRKIGRPRLMWEYAWRTFAGAFWWDAIGAIKPRQVADHIIASPHQKWPGSRAARNTQNHTFFPSSRLPSWPRPRHKAGPASRCPEDAPFSSPLYRCTLARPLDRLVC